MKETALITIDAISSITAACKSFQGAATFLIVFFVGCGAAEQPPSALAPPEPEGADNSAKDLMTTVETPQSRVRRIRLMRMAGYGGRCHLCEDECSLSRRP